MYHLLALVFVSSCNMLSPPSPWNDKTKILMQMKLHSHTLARAFSILPQRANQNSILSPGDLHQRHLAISLSRISENIWNNGSYFKGFHMGLWQAGCCQSRLCYACKSYFLDGWVENGHLVNDVCISLKEKEHLLSKDRSGNKVQTHVFMVYCHWSLNLFGTIDELYCSNLIGVWYILNCHHLIGMSNIPLFTLT